MKYFVFTAGVLQTNSILLQEGRECVVVDIPYGSQDLEKFVEKNNLTVRAVLLTHGHFDHCGGVTHFAKACRCPNVPVWVNERDWDLCLHASQNRWGVPCDDCVPNGRLQEGGLVLGNLHFEILETPGHTGGSVVILANDLMLSGDTLFRNGVGRTDFPESVGAQMTISLQKLATLPGDYTVICGHGEQITLKREKSNNGWLLHFEQ